MAATCHAYDECSKMEDAIVNTHPPFSGQVTATTRTDDAVLDTHFRFLDLPPEIRDAIYSLALVDPESARTGSDADSLSAKPCEQRKCCFAILRPCKPLTARTFHPLYSLCRQIRVEASRVHWGEHLLCMEIDPDEGGHHPLALNIEPDLHTAMQLVQHWGLDFGGITRFRALRDLTVRIALDQVVDVRVTFDGAMRMGVEWLQYDESKKSIPRDVMQWHLANTNHRRVENEWKGEGIVDFFTGDAGLWETWFYINSEDVECE
ncbi:uncharacterized protein LTR77_000246 [Saxophila tyrrhenica]|uniref:Uncharacterized protein n=1 Tax=Saxophila tyrrhenica TaxID=1690608 RepID=A0AAV9PMH2_9PEZI|nr:hypothetical protein LTR77_000246 [Saxophila tyrrhenica]